MQKKIKVTVVGGGTGTFVVLTGLKKYDRFDITAVVSSADSGGSTGRLRDEFGSLPVGDFRQCLVALASDNLLSENILRRLFEYRFDKGGIGLEGHNFGNLFITALIEILGSQEEAFDTVSKILNIKGKVYPVTFDKVQLIAEYKDGTVSYGEEMIDQPNSSHDGETHIRKIWVQPKAKVFENTRLAIENSDLIILGPGDLYTSIIANLVTDDFSGIIKKSKGKIVYISNLVTKYGQTHKFKTSDFVSELEKYIGKSINHILINSTKIPEEIIKKYAVENAFPVEDDLQKDKRVIYADLLSDDLIQQSPSDTVKRSLLRHNSDKIAREIDKLF